MKLYIIGKYRMIATISNNYYPVRKIAQFLVVIKNNNAINWRKLFSGNHLNAL